MYEKYHKRFTVAKRLKSGVESRLKEAYRYALPSADVDNFNNNNFNEMPEVFNDTPITALQKFANRTQQQLTPSWKTWAMLKAGSDIPEEDKEAANLKLEEVTEVIFDHIHHSNFMTASHESHMDLGISTGCLICEEGDGIQSSLKFRSIPMMEMVPEKDAKSNWAEIKVEVGTIIEMYPSAKLNETLNKMLKDEPLKEVDLIEGVIFDHRTRKYNHILLHPKEADVLMDNVVESSPFITYREQVSAGKAMGFGRILQILPTILKLNAMSYYEDCAVIAAATGSYTMRDDGVLNPDNIRISDPFSLLLVDSNDNANPSIRPLEVSARFDVTDVKIKQMEDNINQVMESKSFGNIEETPVRTATEMSIRNSELLKNSQASTGRLQTEFLERILARIVYVLGQAGKIPPLKVNGKEITIKFTSPAARIQDAEELAALQEFRMYTQEMPPEVVAAKFKVEEMPAFVAERTGLPASLMRSKIEEDKAVAGMTNAMAVGGQAESNMRGQ